MTEDRMHDIEAAWSEEACAWRHVCVICGQVTIGDAPDLPCPGPATLPSVDAMRSHP